MFLEVWGRCIFLCWQFGCEKAQIRACWHTLGCISRMMSPLSSSDLAKWVMPNSSGGAKHPNLGSKSHPWGGRQMLRARNVGINLMQLSASPSLPCLRFPTLAIFTYIMIFLRRGCDGSVLPVLEPDVFWHLGTCNAHPVEQLSSAFCLHPMHREMVPGTLCLEPALCVSVALLQLLQRSSRKEK